MQIDFHKYHGTGNDFVMIDDRNKQFPIQKETIAHLCHRHFGIGADGLILIQNDPKYDFKMLYFNADGGEGSMCGNGGRCAVQFAHSLGLFEQKTTFIAVDGTHEAMLQNGKIKLKMIDVQGVVSGNGYYFLNTGSPHYVAFVEDLENFDVATKGRAIRYDETFGKQGTNVNFVEQVSQNELFVRTYERGVEAETYSCGTGVTAAVLVLALQKNIEKIIVKTLGGVLEVSFHHKENQQGSPYFENIFLTGEAKKVFEGSVLI